MTWPGSHLLVMRGVNDLISKDCIVSSNSHDEAQRQERYLWWAGSSIYRAAAAPSSPTLIRQSLFTSFFLHLYSSVILPSPILIRPSHQCLCSSRSLPRTYSPVIFSLLLVPHVPITYTRPLMLPYPTASPSTRSPRRRGRGLCLQPSTLRHLHRRHPPLPRHRHVSGLPLQPLSPNLDGKVGLVTMTQVPGTTSNEASEQRATKRAARVAD